MSAPTAEYQANFDRLAKLSPFTLEAILDAADVDCHLIDEVEEVGTMSLVIHLPHDEAGEPMVERENDLPGPVYIEYDVNGNLTDNLYIEPATLAWLMTILDEHESQED